MSMLMHLSAAAARLAPTPLRSVDRTRAAAVRPQGAVAVPSGLHRRCTITRAQVAGRVLLTLRPKVGASAIQLMYIHGGAYIWPIGAAQWSIIEDLVRRTGASVTVPNYRLVPKGTIDSEMPFLRSVYDSLAAAGGPVVVAGDSAGGGLALALAIRLRDTGGRAPDLMPLFAPWVDVTMSNPQIPIVARHDPLLAPEGLVWCGRAWAGTRPSTDPLVSPLFDDLSGLPKMHIYQGGRDILAPDVDRFAVKARAAGTACKLHYWPQGLHVFMGMPMLPESREALAHAGAAISALR